MGIGRAFQDREHRGKFSKDNVLINCLLREQTCFYNDRVSQTMAPVLSDYQAQVSRAPFCNISLASILLSCSHQGPVASIICRSTIEQLLGA
jgi:hypothetical protein